MRETPISDDCVRELRAAIESVREKESISDETLSRWMRSQCAEVQALACGYFFDDRQWNRTVAKKERVEFLLTFLRRSIVEDCGNVYRVNRYDALLYCQSWLLHENARDQLDGIRLVAELLAEVCTTGGDDLRRAVVDVVLEHVLDKNRIRKCFAFWKSIDGLCSLYNEAIDMVRKWERLSDDNRNS